MFRKSQFWVVKISLSTIDQQGFPIKTILQTTSKKIRHGFYGLSGFTLKPVIKIRVNRLNRRFSVSNFLLFTDKFLYESPELINL
jgi:hypothetical protein